MTTEQRIAELQKQLNELKAILEKKEDGLWNPNSYDDYYFIGNKFSPEITRFDSLIDEGRIESGNCYKTIDEATRHAKRLKLYNKLWKLAEHLNGDWVPDWADLTVSKYVLLNHQKMSLRLILFAIVTLVIQLSNQKNSPKKPYQC